MENKTISTLRKVGDETSPKGERILLRKRQHLFVAILPVAVITLLWVLYLVATLTIIKVFPQLLGFIISLLSVITVFFLLISTKILVDWHCYFYVVTNKRILEVSHKPLFSDKISNIILSQVKSTEIDVETKGILNKILNMGDVIITFDRPTHYDELRLSNLQDPKTTGILLTEVLDHQKPQDDITRYPIWYKTNDDKRPYRITEDIRSFTR